MRLVEIDQWLSECNGVLSAHLASRIQIAEEKQREALELGGRCRLGGLRQCLRVDVLPDPRQFATYNRDVENSMVFPLFVRSFDSSSRDADDQNPVSLCYELGRLRKRGFHRVVRLLK